MSIGYQEVAVVAAVAGAASYVGWRLRQAWTGRGAPACACGGDCGCKTERKATLPVVGGSGCACGGSCGCQTG